MEFDKVAIKIIENYGLAGFSILVVVCGGGFLTYKIMMHFLASLKGRDEQTARIVNSFLDSMEVLKDSFSSMANDQKLMSQDMGRQFEIVKNDLDYLKGESIYKRSQNHGR